jgi:hypothetical protein
MLSYGTGPGFSLPGTSLSEGADIRTTTLTSIPLSATPGYEPADFSGWTCTDAPGSGDLDFPNGTTTGAVEAGIADATAAVTTIDLPGPGYYELTASWNDGTTETLSIYATRPLPVAAEATYSNGAAGTVAAGVVGLTLSDSAGADTPLTYLTTLYRGDTGAQVSVTGSTTATPSATVTDSVDNSGNGYAWKCSVLDKYGRASTMGFATKVSGFPRLDPPTPPAVQQLAATTSTHTVTFVKATGGVGTISYGATLSQTPGGGASIDAVTEVGGNVEVDLIGLADDNVYNVKLTATDSATTPQESQGWGAFMVLNEDPVSATVSPQGVTRTTAGNETFTITPAGGSGAYTYTLQGSFTKPGGSSATLDDDTTTTPDFTGIDEDGEYSATIRVADTADAADFFDVDLYAVKRTPATYPPVLAPPADPNIDANDPAPTLTFTNSGGALVSSVASIVYKPDGSSATLTHSTPSLAPVLNFDIAGEYGVQLSGTNADGTDVRTAKATVNSIAPTANAGPDQLLVDMNSTVNLTGASSTLHPSSVGPLSYAWTWDPTSPNTATINNSTTATPDFTVGSSGLTYIALLTVTDDSTGETDTDTVLVTTEAVSRYPELVAEIDFTAGDALTWTSASTSGTITADAGGTTLATWSRIQAVGNSTGFSYETGGGSGFGLATGLQTSATGVTLGIRIDPVWPTLPNDLDGVIVAVYFTTLMNSGTPPSGRDENVTVSVCEPGASVNANHTNGIRLVQSNTLGAQQIQRNVAGSLVQTTAVTYPGNSQYVMYFRADRSDHRVDVAFGETDFLSVATIDTHAYDYTRTGASALTDYTVSTTPYCGSVGGPSFQWTVRNDWPVADGGGDTRIHINKIALYTSGIAQ